MNYKVTIEGKTYEVEVEREESQPIYLNYQPAAPAAPAPASQEASAATATSSAGSSQGGQEVLAPMEGKILSLNFSSGDKVEAGDTIMILEAMKMENEIVAPSSGTVNYNVAANDNVKADQNLANIN